MGLFLPASFNFLKKGKTRMPKEVAVCSDSFRGSAGETIIFKNNHSSAVEINQNGTATWPFATPPPSPTPCVPAKSNGVEGTLSVTLISTAGTYTYNTTGCPQITQVNPKTVIIS
jgi:hypothetical protein